MDSLISRLITHWHGPGCVIVHHHASEPEGNVSGQNVSNINISVVVLRAIDVRSME